MGAATPPKHERVTLPDTTACGNVYTTPLHTFFEQQIFHAISATKTIELSLLSHSARNRV